MHYCLVSILLIYGSFDRGGITPPAKIYRELQGDRNYSQAKKKSASVKITG